MNVYYIEYMLKFLLNYLDNLFMIIVDPKERLKEEKDGIVLSPQRRSFGTGCHVTTPSITRQVSCPADYKEDTR